MPVHLSTHSPMPFALRSYFGARFVEISGWPAGSAPTTDSMVCHFVHTALPRRSAIQFKSAQGDDTATILNGIHDITVRSALSNFMSTPTDCPSREKRGWTGDGQAAAETLIYNFDMSVTRLLRETSRFECVAWIATVWRLVELTLNPKCRHFSHV
jgi:hypothetical protein